MGVQLNNVFLTKKGKELAQDLLYVRAHPQLNVARPIPDIPISGPEIKLPTRTQIDELDALREEGRKLEKVFASPTGELPEEEPKRWIEKVQLYLRATATGYIAHFDEIVKDPKQYCGNLSPEFNQAAMEHWFNDNPRRQQEWPLIKAILSYLDQVRAELYSKLPS